MPDFDIPRKSFSDRLRSRQKGPQFRGIGARGRVCESLRHRTSAAFQRSSRPSLGSRFSNVRSIRAETGSFRLQRIGISVSPRRDSSVDAIFDKSATASIPHSPGRRRLTNEPAEIDHHLDSGYRAVHRQSVRGGLRASLHAIFQFPFRRSGDRFDY